MEELLITSKTKSACDPFSGPEIEHVIFTTQSQAEIWIACKFGDLDANRSYNESVSLVLKGNLNQKALLNALQSLIKRHESLRSTFSTDGRFMTIFKTLPLTLDYQNISSFKDTEQIKSLNDYLSTDCNYNFDLVRGPLFKIGLIKISETEHQLILTAHHIICDGWSIAVILEELGSLYSANNKGITPDIANVETFSSYAQEQQEFIESTEYFKTEEYWLKQYEKSIPKVTLPTNFKRPQLRTFKGNRLDFEIDNKLVGNLKKIGIQSGASFVATLLAAFEVFLYQQTGQNDIVLGLPAAGQSLSGKTQLVGHCVNLLPLRSKLSAKMPFHKYLKSRKIALFDAYDHQQISFGQLLQKLTIPRDSSRVPLAPIMFNVDMGLSSGLDFDGLNAKLISNPRKYEAFELFLNATNTEDKLILEWSYNTALFKAETIEKMMTSFEEVLKNIVADPNIIIGDLVKIDDTDYANLNNTYSTYPQVPLHNLLSEQAKISKLKQAIKFEEKRLSYEGLERKSNQLAHYFAEQGLSNGDYVAVSLPRSIELVVTLIAIMKSGAAYLPLDPNFPISRLEYMLEDSEAKYLITSKKLSSGIKSNSQVLFFEDLFSNLSKYSTTFVPLDIDANSVAYIMYTSGSTGKPKGVLVTHKNLVNFLTSMANEPGITENDKLLSVTTISFDIAGLELFLPLLKGSELVIATNETAKDSRLMLDLLKKENITMLQATPSTWQMLLDAGWEDVLPLKALCGGEALPLRLAKKILNLVDQLWNVYGPTETTIWSAVKRINQDDDQITIGKPIANTQLYLLDNQNQLVVPNTIGEICIAGDGVSKGYWKRSALTKEKFIENPFGTNSTLYRTGDIGKLLPNGDVQCLGRIDNQVKIRGHRIELGEIEQAIDSIEGIDTSVVIVKNDLLIAFLTNTHLDNLSQTTIKNWKNILNEGLPSHMVPQQFNLLKEFPKTLNEKIDRKALINLTSVKNEKNEVSSSKTESEKIIMSIWKKCLNIEKLAINNDFFELGGHSLLAVKVMAQIEKQTGNRLPLASLLEHPTVHKLASYMDKKYITWDSLVPMNRKGSKTPLFVVHGADYNILLYKNLTENLDSNQPVYALQAKGLSGDIEPHDSIEDMAAHYISEIKSIQPKGPYNLGGFSFGGIISFEMSKQLKAQGEKINTLSLFDSYVYPSYFYSNGFIKKIISNLYNVAQLVFIGLNMFSSIQNFQRRKKLLKIQLKGVFLRFKHGREEQQQMQFNRSSKIDRMHQLAFDRYNIAPQDIKVNLFRVTNNIYFAHDYKFLGWKKLASRGVDKHMLPGNHSQMLSSPIVEQLGNKLQRVLDKANS